VQCKPHTHDPLVERFGRSDDAPATHYPVGRSRYVE
jgi:hypothetical protein